MASNPKKNKFDIEKLKNFNFQATLKRNHWSALAVHLGIITFMVLVVLYGLFYLYLPSTTLHGERIHVPDLEGKHISEIEAFLTPKDLRYVVYDTIYHPDYEPLTIIKQTPVADEGVKVNRKIYLTINALVPPLVTLPDKILNISREEAQLKLIAQKFKVGTLEYVDGKHNNTVMSISINGHIISKDSIKNNLVNYPQGTVVDLQLAIGKGLASMRVPNLLNRELAEAEIYLKGLGLNVGKITFVSAEEGQKERTVVKQKPAPLNNAIIKEGEKVDIWVVGYDPDK